MFTGWTACFLPRTLSRAFPHFCRIIHHIRNYRRPRVHKSTTCAAFGHSTQIWSSLTFSYRVASWWLTRHPRMTRPSLTSLTSAAVLHTSNLLEHKVPVQSLSRLVLKTYTSFSHKYLCFKFLLVFLITTNQPTYLPTYFSLDPSLYKEDLLLFLPHCQWFILSHAVGYYLLPFYLDISSLTS